MSRTESRAARIEHVLREALAPLEMEVRDVTHKHSGLKKKHHVEGIETHFSVKVTSRHFKGMNPLSRHRVVHDLLKSEFESGLHSLKLSTEAPEDK